MKTMIILFLIFSGLLAKNIDKYLDYVNRLINYNFKLSGLNQIHPPFEEITTQGIKFNNTKIHIKIFLISIFNKNAYIVIEKYIDQKLTKKYFKWVKIGDKIGNCKVINITFNNLILKCNNKIIIKTLSENIPGIKEK